MARIYGRTAAKRNEVFPAVAVKYRLEFGFAECKLNSHL